MTAQAHSVLVVDDEPLLRDIVSEWLDFEGYRVLTAEDGADALRVLEGTRVDAVVSDIRMPVMDGVTFLKRLNPSADSHPAVIFVSGFADVTPREAYDLGAEAFLAKPFADSEVLSAVRRVLTPREERWQLPDFPGDCQEVQASFSSPDAARESGHLAFGRGGFCLRSGANLTTTSVCFALDFSAPPLRIAGHGIVRWIHHGEQQMGIEITGLQSDCMAQGIGLTAGSGVRSYIPGTSAKAAAS